VGIRRYGFSRGLPGGVWCRARLGAKRPVLRFSDTWQLVINTSTTVITFLMVFLIQNTQNRDTRAIHAKLDELIVHEEKARNELVLAEDLSDQELDNLKAQFKKLGNGRMDQSGANRVGDQQTVPSPPSAGDSAPQSEKSSKGVMPHS
jgi:low affinity Fe/Cu permease